MKDDPKRTGGVYTHANGSIVLDCRMCGRPKYAKRVMGKISTKHECNAKCLESKGFLCECSCGGKNHGAAYSST